MRYIIDFSDAGERSLVGGKAHGLHQLTRWGLKVPAGFVVSTTAYTEALSDPAVAAPISSHDATAARDAFLRLDLPAGLLDEITQGWHGLVGGDEAGVRVACRSSATVEDSARASFAGQFTTVLGLANPSEVASGVKQCWASAWSAEAVSYRDTSGIDHPEVSMAVVVQRMVRAEVSGVAFSVNPVTRDASEVMINSSWGLGETVVSGLVTPDTFLVRKGDLQVATRDISQSKNLRHVVTSTGDVEEQQVPAHLAVASSLTDEQVREVAELAILAEQRAGSPQDVEWAYERGALNVLQTRPVTTV